MVNMARGVGDERTAAYIVSYILLPLSATQAANLAQAVVYAWRALPVPVIACIHGVCFGGGLQIALGADFRYATPDAQLSIMEVCRPSGCQSHLLGDTNGISSLPTYCRQSGA